MQFCFKCMCSVFYMSDLLFLSFENPHGISVFCINFRGFSMLCPTLPHSFMLGATTAILLEFKTGREESQVRGVPPLAKQHQPHVAHMTCFKPLAMFLKITFILCYIWCVYVMVLCLGGARWGVHYMQRPSLQYICSPPPADSTFLFTGSIDFPVSLCRLLNVLLQSISQG